jgi:hypothetical protein
VQDCLVGHTITIRLTPKLAAWLEKTSRDTGVPQSRLIREQLERVVGTSNERSYMRLAGALSGPDDLSSRKGFSKPVRGRGRAHKP